MVMTYDKGIPLFMEMKGPKGGLAKMAMAWKSPRKKNQRKTGRSVYRPELFQKVMP